MLCLTLVIIENPCLLSKRCTTRHSAPETPAAVSGTLQTLFNEVKDTGLKHKNHLLFQSTREGKGGNQVDSEESRSREVSRGPEPARQTGQRQPRAVLVGKELNSVKHSRAPFLFVVGGCFCVTSRAVWTEAMCCKA